VLGVPVMQHLRTRRDEPGSLVALADGRYAFTGPILAVGSRRAVQAAARRRLRDAPTDAERAWWEEVVGTMAA
jgi:cell volume regulation protein A